ncbi:MAG: xanthine dehydrogenase family protein molybdopterin-binding subunit [Pseudomonadota bacterium]
MTTTHKDLDTSRRSFLKGAAALAGGALVVGFGPAGRVEAAAKAELVANPFVKITGDGRVVAIVKHVEMGQGTTTGLTTMIAEELDADWGQMDTEFAPADPATYGNKLMGGAQGTGGSTATPASFEPYRKAGATARDLLVRAAAEEWSVPAGEITVKDGVVSHASGKSAQFGELVARASTLTPTENPQLKSPDQFTKIGSETLPRRDSVSKTTGTAVFALDVRVPDMVVAVVARPPQFGATLKSVDDSETRKVKGVLDVKETPVGVIVYGKNTWAAIKGRAALTVEWDASKADLRSTDQMVAEYTAELDKPGNVARNDGDAAGTMKQAAKTVKADFVFPYLAHAPMETLNCVIKFDGTTAELWDGCQFPSLVQPSVARILGLKPEQVKINTVWAGGSFGRRATPTADYQSEAAHAVKAIDGKWPVQLVWTREDDLQSGYYRPLFVHRVEAGIDGDGKPLAYHHKLAGKSILIGTFFEQMLVKDGIDTSSVEGATTLPYQIPNLRVDVRNMTGGPPALWWRSVGHTHTAYSTEIIMDMMAEAAGKDPVAYREALLTEHPRHLGVLKLAAEKAGWGEPLQDGWGRGVAVHESFSSFVALVAEVSKTEGGDIKLERIVCAVDCGIAINPDVIRAQMEGGIGYGLGAVMRNKITLADGVVEQQNFPDYEPLRITDMPKIEVHIVPSTTSPTGVGEPGTPPAGPALANAIYAATGNRVTTLPMTDSGISFV